MQLWQRLSFGFYLHLNLSFLFFRILCKNYIFERTQKPIFFCQNQNAQKILKFIAIRLLVERTFSKEIEKYFCTSVHISLAKQTTQDSDLRFCSRFVAVLLICFTFQPLIQTVYIHLTFY